MLKTLHTATPTLVTTNTKISNNSIIILLMYVLHDHDVSINTNTLSHIHMYTHIHIATCCGVPNTRGRFGIKHKSLTMWIVCILLGASFLVILYTMNHDSTSSVGGRDLND